jgi:hypothetical protein
VTDAAPEPQTREGRILKQRHWLKIPVFQGTVSSLVILGADGDKVELNCWEHILNSGEIDTRKVPDFTKHGFLLTELRTHCTIFKSEDDGSLIVRNKKGEQYVPF